MKTLAFLLLLASASGFSQNLAQLHGTVNIIFANKQGIVALTDSQLSSPSGIPVGSAQKLFQIDGQTICLIAGWYSDAGPTIDQIHYPAYIVVPTLIRWFIQESHGLKPMSMEDKLRGMAKVFTFSLEAMADLDLDSGGQPSNEPSEISLAGLEDGKYKIVHLELIPRRVGSQVVYDEQNFSSDTVGTKLIYRVAGIKDVAESFLTEPQRQGEFDSFLQYYSEAIKKDGGMSLSLDDMEETARVLERRTAEKYPLIVGGPLQIYTVTPDGADAVTHPTLYNSDSAEISHIILKSENVGIVAYAPNGNGAGNATGLVIRDPLVAFVVGGEFDGVTQVIDNIFFYRTKFDHCVLLYDGSPKFIFDKSNTIISSTLKLAPGLGVDSEGVANIVKDFPYLVILDANGRKIN